MRFRHGTFLVATAAIYGRGASARPGAAGLDAIHVRIDAETAPEQVYPLFTNTTPAAASPEWPSSLAPSPLGGYSSPGIAEIGSSSTRRHSLSRSRSPTLPPSVTTSLTPAAPSSTGVTTSPITSFTAESTTSVSISTITNSTTETTVTLESPPSRRILTEIFTQTTTVFPSAAQSSCMATTSTQDGTACIMYCSTATSFSVVNVTTLTDIVTVSGNKTFFPTGFSITTLFPPQPCTSSPPKSHQPRPIRVACAGEFCMVTTSTVLETMTALPPTPTVTLITGKTAVVISTTSVPPNFGDPSFINKAAPPSNPPTAKPPVSFPGPPGGPIPQTQVADPTTQGPSVTQGSNNSPVNSTPGPNPTQRVSPHVATVNSNPDPIPPQNIVSQLTTLTLNGVPIVIEPGVAVIGGQTFTPTGGLTTITVGGQVFSINPSQIIGPGTTIGLPPIGAPTLTNINGVLATILGSSTIVIDGSTFAIGPGATPTTAVINGQIISIGPSGVGLEVASGQEQSLGIEINSLGSSSSVAIIDGTTFTFGPGSAPSTVVIGGQAVSIGPGGVGLAGTTIVGPITTTIAGPSDIGFVHTTIMSPGPSASNIAKEIPAATSTPAVVQVQGSGGIRLGASYGGWILVVCGCAFVWSMWLVT